uniref:Strictosidine synthase conserved region domain-containing protein n=1 Tax=Lactuca sativa TaxID=4236 RepID=A0A9R1VXL8_LACSA|nr:hypothetical protein LSAT_V11C400201720 [Lactuca sativa]
MHGHPRVKFVSGEYAKFEKLVLPEGVIGPEAVTFGGVAAPGPYTMADQRILKYWNNGTHAGFSTMSEWECGGVSHADRSRLIGCGQPVDLSYYPNNDVLYISDAEFGILSVGMEGGLASVLVAGEYNNTNGIDVDLLTGNIYFSSVNFFALRTTYQKVSVLMSNLGDCGGPAVSIDGTFVLVPDNFNSRVLKYWLVGPKADTNEVLMNLPGKTNRIKRGETPGEFWVAASRWIDVKEGKMFASAGMRFNSDGVVLETIDFFAQYTDNQASVVQEKDGKLYVGSYLTNFIGVYSN